MISKSNNNSYHDGGSAFFSTIFPKKTRTLMPLRLFLYFRNFMSLNNLFISWMMFKIKMVNCLKNLLLLQKIAFRVQLQCYKATLRGLCNFENVPSFFKGLWNTFRDSSRLSTVTYANLEYAIPLYEWFITPISHIQIGRLAYQTSYVLG